MHDEAISCIIGISFLIYHRGIYDRPDKIKSLVERMLALHRRFGRTPQEKEILAREIEAVDAQIDRLVYELYGLTDEEIRIVESGWMPHISEVFIPLEVSYALIAYNILIKVRIIVIMYSSR